MNEEYVRRLSADYDAMKERVRLLERELAAARVGQAVRGAVVPTCPWLVDTLPCRCGFAAIEAASRRAAEEEP